MLGAFVHCAYLESPLSGNWDISDCIIDNVDAFYDYDVNGYCQTKGEVGEIRFANLDVTNLKKPSIIFGGSNRQLKMKIRNSSFSFTIWKTEQEHVNANTFDALEFHNVTLNSGNSKPVIVAQTGNTVWLDRVQTAQSNKKPYELLNIGALPTEASKKDIPPPEFPIPPLESSKNGDVG
jgi:hypothetical protein